VLGGTQFKDQPKEGEPESQMYLDEDKEQFEQGFIPEYNLRFDLPAKNEQVALPSLT